MIVYMSICSSIVHKTRKVGKRDEKTMYRVPCCSDAYSDRLFCPGGCRRGGGCISGLECGIRQAVGIGQRGSGAAGECPRGWWGGGKCGRRLPPRGGNWRGDWLDLWGIPVSNMALMPRFWPEGGGNDTRLHTAVNRLNKALAEISAYRVENLRGSYCLKTGEKPCEKSDKA